MMIRNSETNTALTEKHIDFLKAEFGIDDVDSLDDEVFDEIYEKLCDIEIDEFVDSDESERGDTAVEIMDYMAEQYDYDDDDEVFGERSAKAQHGWSDEQ